MFIIITMKRMCYILIFCSLLTIPLCGNKNKENYVPLEQLNIDKSNNYKFIFKEIISEQNKREERERKDPFKD
jgi:hypothetical protein